MLRLNDIRRLFDVIKRRIFLMIGRAIVMSIDNSGLYQRAQLNVLSGETISDVERIQEYGLETYPWNMEIVSKEYRGADSSHLAEVEAITIFQNGDRGRGLIIRVGDRYYRPADLSQGEVAIYTFKDKSSGNHRIHLKNDQTIEIKGSTLNITCTGNVNITASSNVSVTANGTITLDGGSGSTTGVCTGGSICHFTGAVHADVSSNVKASKP